MLDIVLEGALDLLLELGKMAGVAVFECVTDCLQILTEDGERTSRATGPE
jgi:hypothetical protein